MKMNFEEFVELSKAYNVIPVYERITGDLLTPVLAFLKIREKNKYCFLLESVEGIGRLARYSFIGKDPAKIISNKGNLLKIIKNGDVETKQRNIFEFLKEEIKSYKFPNIDDLPDFTGGIVGYLGYENISLIENVIEFNHNENSTNPDSIFGFFNTLIAFDHFKHQLLLITNVHINGNSDIEFEYNNAKNILADLKREISTPLKYKSDFIAEKKDYFNVDKNDFFEIVEKTKNHIYEGDVFQMVISKKFETTYSGDLLNVYRALRIINPSPYMYFMEFGNDLSIIGTSPEDLIKVKDRKANILPIAGTRRRGKDLEEDRKLEDDLRNDPKEIAEHIMLVDLARNDLGRVCDYDSVKVTEYINVHRFSHVMHLVSKVEGILKEDKDCIDALTAAFPAGTVSGAPKIKAIQLIHQYEKQLSNIYAGAVGYIDFSGNLDMCITIRTLFADSEKIYWQAGAGIVADSKPELELKEIKNKAAVLLNAIKYAEVIDEDISN